MSPGRRSDGALLEALRRNSTATLTIAADWDDAVLGEVCHFLHLNTSITGIHFDIDATGDAANEAVHHGCWVPLLSLFPVLSRRIAHLTVSRNLPFVVLPTMMWQFRNLTSLTLEGAVGLDWSFAEWKSFAAALQGHPHLTSFEFRQDSAPGDPGRDRLAPNSSAVAEALATAPHLAAFRQEARSTTGWSPTNGGGGGGLTTAPGCGVQVSVLGFASLLGSASLERLRYAGLGFGTNGMDERATSSAWMQVARALSSSGVTTLRLPNSFLTPEAVSWIVSGMQGVVTLDLSRNTVGSPKVVEALIRKESLQDLNLSYCDLSEVCLLRIAQTLPHNRSLRRLDLTGNCAAGRGLAASFAGFAQDMRRNDRTCLVLGIDRDGGAATDSDIGGGGAVGEIDAAHPHAADLAFRNAAPVEAMVED